MLLFNIIIFSVDTKCWTAPPRSHCEESCWDLPRGPVVKTPPPFSEEVWVRPLARELRSHTPCSPKTKTSNRSDIATNSVKTLKIIHSNIYMYFFFKRLAAASDMWSCGCSDLWSKKRQVSLLPSRMGFWMEKSALLTVFKSERFTIGCNSWTWSGLGPWRWGNSGPENPTGPSPGHTGRGSPTWSPDLRAPRLLSLSSYNLAFHLHPGLANNQVWQHTHLLFCLSA